MAGQEQNSIRTYFKHHPRDIGITLLFLLIGTATHLIPCIIIEDQGDVIFRVLTNSESGVILDQRRGHMINVTNDESHYNTILDEPGHSDLTNNDSFQLQSIVENGKFNPNEVDFNTLRRLNVPATAARNWVKYLAAGGRFHRSDDLSRVYGLEADSVAKYARYFQWPKQIEKPYDRTSVKIDINMADTSEWRKLPGIGHVLSKRIVKFRKQLRGFSSVEQLAQVYGIRDSVYRNILPYLEYGVVHEKINLNDASEKELASHPYINWKQAQILTRYRDMHGPYQVTDDVLKTAAVDSLWLIKMKPYLELGHPTTE